MNGENYKILNNSYQLICIAGFFILIIYILFWVFIYFYMKNKYYIKTEITVTDKKINEINQSDTTEKRIIKCLTYILFLIVFFHQYIIEYYIFGFLGYLLNKFNALNLNASEVKNNNDNYTKYINSHLFNLIFAEILVIFINFVTTATLLSIFILFILIHSYKTLYISTNYAIYSNRKNLIINTIILNLNPLFGIVNYFFDTIKFKFVLSFIIIIIFLILIKLAVNYYHFSILPYKFEFLCVFIESFGLFGCATNLITYLTKSEINSTNFKIIKIIFELLNALGFTFIFIKKKNEKSMKSFSDNLFCNIFKSLNPSGIYYYMTRYIKYSKNKIKNYMTIFELIQNHILNCENKDCPGNKLLPKSISYSIFTDFEYYSNFSNNSKSPSPNPDIGSIKVKQENKNDIKNTESNKKSKFKQRNVKYNKKSNKIFNEVINNNEEKMCINNNKKILEDTEFIMIGEQEIINRINFLYCSKKFDYMQTYIFLHL